MPSRGTESVRVAHVITGLGTGGAETMLVKLITASHRRSALHSVFPLMGGGAQEALLRELGVPVQPLGMRPSLPDPRAVLRLARLLRQSGAEVVQTWLYHGDLVGGLAGKLAHLPVVWGVHHSTLDPTATKLSTRLVMQACSLLSARLPRVIVACSEASVKAHVEAGYASENFRVIHNGFDLTRFQPQPHARSALRAELGIPANALVVGHVGRWNANKDYPTLILAAQRVAERRGDTHFALIGDRITKDNLELVRAISAAELPAERLHLLGPRADIPHLMSGFDVLCQSSLSEAFPSVLGEAMACGVPCAATDVGDSAVIIGDTGRIVPRKNPSALGDAILSLLSLDEQSRRDLAASARARISLRFGLDSAVRQYLDVYQTLAAR